MSEWQPIATAPKDGSFVRLKSQAYAPREPFYWSKRKRLWETIQFTVMGSRRAWWDKDIEQPTHWMPVPDKAEAA